MTNPLEDRGHAKETLAKFLSLLVDSVSLNLTSHISACNGQVQPDAEPSTGTAPVATAPSPWITVEFTGSDTPALLARNGELLHAIEHVAAKILRLEPEDHDRISFDADGFKANRDRELYRSAAAAIRDVQATGRPHSFPPMTSRERRMLHLALSKSGLPTASSGEGPSRFVVLYPEGPQPGSVPGTSAMERTQEVRNRFRRRS